MVSIAVYTGALFHYSRKLKGIFHPKPHSKCLYRNICDVLSNSDNSLVNAVQLLCTWVISSADVTGGFCLHSHVDV